MSEKATNDAAAFIRTISEREPVILNGQKMLFGKSISVTETEALKEGLLI
jgi:hypothetical protein